MRDWNPILVLGFAIGALWIMRQRVQTIVIPENEPLRTPLDVRVL